MGVWATAGVVGGATAAGIGSLGLAGYLRRHRDRPGARWFAVTLCAQSLACLAYASGVLTAEPGPRLALEALTWTGLLWTGPLFLAFALDYTGRGGLLDGWRAAPLFVVPAAATVALASGGWRSLVWSGFRVASTRGLAVAQYHVQLPGAVAMSFGLASAGVGVLLLVETVLSYGPLYRREAGAVSLSTVPPFLGLIAWLFDLGPWPALNLGVPLFLPHVVLDAYAFVGTDMFRSNPTTRRAAERTAVDDLPSPVVILDTEDRVVDCNAVAESALGLSRPASLGATLDDAVSVDLDPVIGDETDDVTVRTGDGRRVFTVRTSPLWASGASRVGRTVVFEDVTGQRRREEQLAVLNRVLRHNLRNKVTVIGGYADRVAARTDDERIVEWASSIDESGHDVLSIAEKARRFEGIRDRGLSPTDVDVPSLVDDVAAECREASPAATVVTDCDLGGRTTVWADRELLRLVLANLLENAVEHNPAPEPLADLGARRGDDGGVVFEVRDDGPGIPESEFTPLRGGAEQQLEHGSGIGLWLVQWGVALLDGTLDVSQDGEGATVRVSLPDRR